MTHPREPFSFRFTDVRRSVDQDVTATKGFPIGYRAITDELIVPLSARMIDLLRIASSVYMVDRLVKRDRKHNGQWARHIKCSIPVRDEGYWSESPVSEFIRESVEFVSGDIWEFEFVPDSRPFDYQWQKPLPGVYDGDPKVCLYSGGLDSAAGLARQLSQDSSQQFIPVTVRHRTDLGEIVTKQLAEIAGHFNTELRPVVVPFEMDTPKKVVGNEETSQRARAFLFVCVGGVVAWAKGASSLELYESGIGAINVPLLAGMEGSQATRSAHPTFLKKMSRLLGEVSGRTIDVQLPFDELTKGEVVRVLNQSNLHDIARTSPSCVGYPLRNVSAKSCGLCPACIFRRVALHAAEIEEPNVTYQHDLLDPNAPKLARRKMNYLLAFLNQIDSLSNTTGRCLPLSVSKHLSRTELIRAGEPQQPFIDLYAKYHREWMSFIRTAKANGCQWCDLIELPTKAA